MRTPSKYLRHVCLPAMKSDNIKPKYLKGKYRHDLLDPVRLPYSVIEKKKASLTPLGFSGQFQQTPIVSGDGFFDCSKLRFETLVPNQHNPAEWKRVWRYWDPAGTFADGDYTVGAKVGLDREGNEWILHIARGQWSPYHREQMIVSTAKADGAWVWIGIEEQPGSAGAEVAAATIKRLSEIGHSRVRADKVTGKKEVRANDFANSVGSGIVHVPARASWLRVLLDEMENYPVSKYDDQCDALGGGHNMLTKVVCVGRAF